MGPTISVIQRRSRRPPRRSGRSSTGPATIPATTPSIAPHSGNRRGTQCAGAIIAHTPQASGTKHHAVVSTRASAGDQRGGSRLTSAPAVITTEPTEHAGCESLKHGHLRAGWNASRPAGYVENNAAPLHVWPICSTWGSTRVEVERLPGILSSVEVQILRQRAGDRKLEVPSGRWSNSHRTVRREKDRDLLLRAERDSAEGG